MDRKQLIDTLTQITLENKTFAEALLLKSETELNHSPSDDTWNILECIEHLNLYGNFYLPEIASCIAKADESNRNLFKSGFLGNYFVKLIQPKPQLNKMKTATKMNPKGRRLTKNCLQVFIRQQNQLLDLLQKAHTTDLTQLKTKISISRFLRLRLGDTLQFMVYHNQRHMKQVQDILEANKKNTLEIRRNSKA
ncbi:DinB family protein [Capnocytophaga canimorsus]|uniref:DinB family protein n=1 Tax=Capnocytophaga canimorsus TaxID=28188 RepID=UPI0037D7EB9E